MAQHTPGPYSVDVTNEVHWADQYAIMIYAPDGKTPVGTACDFNRTDRDDEKRANARLLAAAPDLLWALETLMEVASDIAAEQCDDGENVTYWNRATGAGWRALKQAQAAISKANGD